MYEKIDILKHFFEDPYRQFYIRELARLTKLNPMTITKKLKQFQKEKLILKEKTNLYPVYKANVESKQFKNLKLFYNLEKIRKSGLVEYLNKKYLYPQIIVFGSYSRADDVPQSDIDVVVISPERVDENLKSFERILKRTISIQNFTKKEWEELKRKNLNLVMSMLSGINLSKALDT